MKQKRHPEEVAKRPSRRTRNRVQPNPNRSDPVTARPASAAASMAVRVSLGALFAAFFRLGCTSFGGGTAGWLHRDMVERRRWIDDAGLSHGDGDGAGLAGCQWHQDVAADRPAIVAGNDRRSRCVVGPVDRAFPDHSRNRGAVYAGIAGQPIVHAVLDGIAAAVMGLTFATGLRSLASGARGLLPLIVAALAVLCVGILRWPIVPVILVLAPLSIGLRLRQTRGGRACVTGSAMPCLRWRRCSCRCHWCRSAAAMRCSRTLRSNRSTCTAGSATREFADFFALSRAAPGPGSMLVALIGWKIAGLTGALVATAALYLPARGAGLWRGAIVGSLARLGLARGSRARHGADRRRVIPVGRHRRVARLARRARRYGWPRSPRPPSCWCWPRLHPLPLLAAGGGLFGLAAAF